MFFAAKSKTLRVLFKVFGGDISELIDNQFEDGAVSGAQTIAPGPDGQWIMPETVALFTADFGRDNHDLILRTEDGVTLRLDG